jgi:hypothetical protein
VELSGKRSRLFEITISEKALSEFVIWVIHSPRFASRCLLGVSLRSLSSRPLEVLFTTISFLCCIEMAEEVS